MNNLRDLLLCLFVLLAVRHPVHAFAEVHLVWPEFQLPQLTWSDQVKPGLSEEQVKRQLEGMGIPYADRPGGLTYTSLVWTPQRDYLFCGGRLYALVEGAFVSGEQFIRWLQTFLSAHKQYGEPIEYVADERSGIFQTTWKLDDGSNLYFQLRSNLKDQQGWTRQLYSREVGAPCLEDPN